MKISNYVNVPPLLLSSENNGNVSLFVKSSIVLAIMYTLSANGYTANEGDVISIVDNLITVVALIYAVWGGFRKILNRYKIDSE